jgi:hypothetical protein
MRRRIVLASTVVVLGCGEPARPRPEPTTPDKRALYGDPSLVPTREGERIRREIALAGELEQTLRLFAELEDVRVHVDSNTTPARVAVVGRASPHASADLHARVEAVVGGMVGPNTSILISIARPAPEPPVREPPLGLALALSLLGLGISIGVTADRLARRRR